MFAATQETTDIMQTKGNIRNARERLLRDHQRCCFLDPVLIDSMALKHHFRLQRTWPVADGTVVLAVAKTAVSINALNDTVEANELVPHLEQCKGLITGRNGCRTRRNMYQFGNTTSTINPLGQYLVAADAKRRLIWTGRNYVAKNGTQRDHRVAHKMPIKYKNEGEKTVGDDDAHQSVKPVILAMAEIIGNQLYTLTVGKEQAKRQIEFSNAVHKANHKESGSCYDRLSGPNNLPQVYSSITVGMGRCGGKGHFDLDNSYLAQGAPLDGHISLTQNPTLSLLVLVQIATGVWQPYVIRQLQWTVVYFLASAHFHFCGHTATLMDKQVWDNLTLLGRPPKPKSQQSTWSPRHPALSTPRITTRENIERHWIAFYNRRSVFAIYHELQKLKLLNKQPMIVTVKRFWGKGQIKKQVDLFAKSLTKKQLQLIDNYDRNNKY